MKTAAKSVEGEGRSTGEEEQETEEGHAALSEEGGDGKQRTGGDGQGKEGRERVAMEADKHEGSVG